MTPRTLAGRLPLCAQQPPDYCALLSITKLFGHSASYSQKVEFVSRMKNTKLLLCHVQKQSSYNVNICSLRLAYFLSFTPYNLKKTFSTLRT